MTGVALSSLFRPSRILISDDEVLSREILLRKLTSLGYECDCCETSRSALEMLAQKPYDLFITDIVQQEESRALFLEKVLSARPGVAIILVTSEVNIEVAVDSLKHGAYDYITKPFSIEEMAHSVSRALEKRRLLLENRKYQQTLEEQVASRTRQLKDALGVLEQTYHSTLVALSKALDSRDADPDGHTLRVTAYAVRLARQMGVGEAEVRVIEQGVLLHDVGNIGIPDALLVKKDALDDGERAMMRQHPEIGCKILSRIKFLKAPAIVVLHHHERYDGLGYPQGLKGEEIHLGARIFAVADALENLTYARSSLSVADFESAAVEIRAMSGTRLDPGAVDAFSSIPAGEWQSISQEVASNAGNNKFRRPDSGATSAN
jgi:response regulator RpfG family c-di-GMP phosphodiesterase